jgi:peroxidase
VRFARALQRACANYLKDPTLSIFNDLITPGRFDNAYYQNLQRGFGLLASDSVLMSDPRTRPFVLRYALNQTAFFQDFAKAMQKLSLYRVLTGPEGEVRRRCDSFNNI